MGFLRSNFLVADSTGGLGPVPTPPPLPFKVDLSISCVTVFRYSLTMAVDLQFNMQSTSTNCYHASEFPHYWVCPHPTPQKTVELCFSPSPRAYSLNDVQQKLLIASVILVFIFPKTYTGHIM